MISQLFIKRPVMTTLVMIAILFFGIVAYKQIPVSDLPNVNYPAITVSVEYPGANPSTIANNVVSPLERQFLKIEGVQSIASTSSTGTATIVLQFVLEKSIDTAALDVQNAINTAGPRPITPFYNDVSTSVQITWHPSTGVHAPQTPDETATFMSDVLQGKRLL